MDSGEEAGGGGGGAALTGPSPRTVGLMSEGSAMTERQQQDRLEEVIRTLVEQQSALKGIADMQQQLQSTVRRQHKTLERRLAEIAQMRPGPGACFRGDGQVPEDVDAEQVTLLEKPMEATATEPEPAHAHRNSQDVPLAPKHSFAVPSQFKSWRGRKPRESDIAAAPLGQFGSRREVQCLRWLLSHPLWDTFVGVLILLNFVALFCELHWKAFYIEQFLDLRPDDGGWAVAEFNLMVLDRAFNTFYLVEVILQLLVFGMSYCRRDMYHLFDMLAVFACAAYSLVAVNVWEVDITTDAVFRLVKVLRVIRLLRFLRVLRVFGMFSALHVLVKTISKSMGSLFWSMVVLGFIILAFALVVFHLVQGFILDETKDLAHRQWVYDNYGSAVRASYSIFEATFSGKWATHLARPLIDNVSPWFRLYWVIFAVAVNFAVIRVVGALFLKQTLDVAAIDEERKASMRLEERERSLGTLREIFRLGDQEGDGVLTRDEFETMMNNEDVLDMFDELEMEAPEVYMLFNILCEDDGVADQEEFLNGALKLKTTVKTVDVIQLLHEQMALKRSVALLQEGLQHVDKALHPGSPWQPKMKRAYGSSVMMMPSEVAPSSTVQ